MQRYCRGYLARLKHLQLKYNAKVTVTISTIANKKLYFMQAIIIQKFVRGWLARRNYQKQRRQIILCQATVRRHFARKQYKKLKIEARSIEHVKKLNKGLENKIISLQQKIEDLNKVQNDYKNAQNEIHDLRLVLLLFCLKKTNSRIVTVIALN